MKCSHPYRLFPTGRLTEYGKPEYFFSDKFDTFIPVSSLEKKWPDHFWSTGLTEFIEVPCGKCYGCLSDKAFQWSFRCTAEALMYEPGEIWFFTLTYSPENLPEDNEPKKKDLSAFLKRLRSFLGREWRGLRFFACGEKGELTERAHIHCLLFGFPGKYLRHYAYDDRQYVFPDIEKIWGKGFCPGSMCLDPSAAGRYCAKYQLKDFGRSGCWINMSNRPGIGFPYLEKLAREMDPQDPKALVIPTGRGSVLRAGVPKALRERLSMSSALLGEAQYARLYNEMKNAGYTDEQCLRYVFVEAYREALERIAKSKEKFAILAGRG